MKQLRYVEHLAIQREYDIRQREYLPPFGAMFGLALSLHILLLGIWSLFPGTQPLSIPLQALQVRLGGGEDAQRVGQSASKKTSGPNVSAKTPVPKPQQKPKSAAITPSKPLTQPKPQAPLPTVSPGRRTVSPLSPVAGQGSQYGNASVGQQVMERYTRQISLQVQTQAKGVRLTEELKRLAQGKPVVVELLLVIGQDGRLQRYQVSRSSGFEELDRAAIGAAYNAAPFPPPPAEYSGYGFKVAVFVD